MSKLIGEFVATPWEVTARIGPLNAKRVIDHAVDQGYLRSAKQLATQAGLTSATLTTLQRSQGASLEVLARLAAAARVPIAAVLDDSMWKEFPDRIPPAQLAHLSPVTTRRKLDWAQIKAEVASAIEKGEVGSLQRASRRVGVDQSQLAGKLGEEARARLVTLAALHRKERAAKRFEELCQSIRSARVSLSQTGGRLSGRAISAQIGVSANTPNFRRALALVNKEETSA
jgi:transcriptional regulator with XRE-family HTH domain